MTTLRAACLAALITSLTFTGALAAEFEDVVARTKTTQATYALYNWYRLTKGSEVSEEWAAEFNFGDMHRVETPRDRIVANCKFGIGTWYSLVTGETVTSTDIAKTACGISTRAAFTSTAWKGAFSSPFGKVDRIQVTDAQVVRNYDVTLDGVIVVTKFQNLDGTPALDTLGATIIHELPAGRMFEPSSLQQSFVPERYKIAPKTKLPD